MRTVKQDVESLLNRLPDDVSVEDIQYHLYVLDKVRRGLEDLVARTGADELMVTANIFDHAKRKRSFEIMAQVRDA